MGTSCGVRRSSSAPETRGKPAASAAPRSPGSRSPRTWPPTRGGRGSRGTFAAPVPGLYVRTLSEYNEYAENPPQIGEEGLEYNVSCQGLNRLKHPQKIQRRREMQFEHFTCMLIKHPEKSNADAKFVLTKSSVLLKLYTKLRSFFSFRPKAREKIQRRRKMHFDQTAGQNVTPTPKRLFVHTHTRKKSNADAKCNLNILHAC